MGTFSGEIDTVNHRSRLSPFGHSRSFCFCGYPCRGSVGGRISANAVPSIKRGDNEHKLLPQPSMRLQLRKHSHH
ncbi:hypothetical protein THTE_4357 [Thermogutta terrifontis]|uniref:Uncharacterized protein n=1 Tax=Thermogutta terrifontis TaxID=1331910 RepID=A0A286RLW3_9BACT|nr:hypothetical protein THTE_4357 [Thermogutta terrifontis]